jgi:UDPglucose 6-dehydrogenase
LVICEELLSRGARLQAFDPEASESFRERFGERVGMTYTATNYDALNGADALIVCTEWSSFRQPNMKRMKQLMREAVVFDGRNIFERKEMRKEQFTYYPIGRPPVVPEA